VNPLHPHNALPALQQLDPARFDSIAILKKLVSARERLAELKGLAQSMPNPQLLISSLGLQEAKDSSAIENIVTTHDQNFRQALQADEDISAASKEVVRYRHALSIGWQAVQNSRLLTLNHICDIQAALQQTAAGFRKLPGTALKNNAGETIYTPPSPEVMTALLRDLETFINEPDAFPADPLVKMALIHHQFESIHPFYDGNGRTGRIINVLYLVKEGLLDSPILYLSRAIIRSKQDYFHLLQHTRDQDDWEGWVLYMLEMVENTAVDAIWSVQIIKAALRRYKHAIRKNYRFYSQDLINLLFLNPYSTIELLQRELHISRVTARNWLERLSQDGYLQKHKVGRNNYYINIELFTILTGEPLPSRSSTTRAMK